MNKIARRSMLFAGGFGLAGMVALRPVQANTAENEMSLSDRTEIIETVNKIGILSDLRDWSNVLACFTETVEFDYTALLGGQPTTTTAATQIQQWSDFFSGTFKTTQHLIGSHIVRLNGDTVPGALRDRATCKAHFQAHHVYLDSSKADWTIAGTYSYELVQSDGWKVSRMQMTPLWETGERP